MYCFPCLRVLNSTESKEILPKNRVGFYRGNAKRSRSPVLMQLQMHSLNLKAAPFIMHYCHLDISGISVALLTCVTSVLFVFSDSGQVKLHPSLFLLLLVLSRLYPSPMDGSSSPLGLAPFLPFIIRWVSVPQHWQSSYTRHVMFFFPPRFKSYSIR